MTRWFRSMALAGVASVGLVVASGGAQAVAMKAVYTGTVYSSYDDSGVFGQGAGAGALDGQTFTLTYVFDTELAGVGHYGTADFNTVYGGNIYGLADPMVSAELKIGSIVLSATGSDDGEARNYNDGSSAYGFHYAFNTSDNGLVYDSANLYAYVYDPLVAVPLSLTAAFTISTASPSSYGFFGFSHFDYGLNQYTMNTGGYFDMSSLTVAPVSSVPVPGALPLLASGVAIVGAVGRRRRKKSAA